MDFEPADPAAGRDERHCPHCADTHIHRWGKPGGSQRFRCRSCGRTFNALTGTACAGLRRAELWIDYRAAIVEQLSIRKAAKRCGINPSTALRWRRRLANPAAPADDGALSRASASRGRAMLRQDSVDFVDWAHAVRGKADGDPMRVHVEGMFGLSPRSARRTPKHRQRAATPRPGSSR